MSDAKSKKQEKLSKKEKEKEVIKAAQVTWKQV